ncbi:MULTISPECIES: hypothetical protein [Halorussus]|uniref:hypothetical protein n=1 Tax=Halorussus TaxID=1070314 RepID=UPI0013B36EF1|nr:MULTISPECIES: hypothetical protein [Halorussus]NHN60452.1 hypothetical protein [Halorussus sp. JP-T4]
MTVNVSYGSLISFFEQQSSDTNSDTPTTETNGLCLLAGEIVGRNLRNALARRGIKAGRTTNITTIEDTAVRLLEEHHRNESADWPQVRQLDGKIYEQFVLDAITEAADDDGLDVVESFLGRINWEDRDDLLETLVDELDRYYRCTDAGDNHEEVTQIASNLGDEYAKQRSSRALSAFDQLHNYLQNRTEPLPDTEYLSRSHLVKAARERMAENWSSAYPDVEWVAVATINVLDNPTLRFFEELASIDAGPEVYFFFNEDGSGEDLKDRLDSTSVDVSETDQFDRVPQSPVSELMDTAAGLPPSHIDDVEFVEAPDTRRELEHIARRIREITGQGVSDADSLVEDASETELGDIIIAAKDVIPYRSTISDVFTTHSIPFHVEGRRPMMQTTAYRYLQSVFELLNSAHHDEPVDYWELIDPLRLGFCPPEDYSEMWPVSDDVFLEFEQRLHEVQREAGRPMGVEAGAMTLEDWRAEIEALYVRSDAEQLFDLIDWIDDTSSGSPESGDAIATLTRDLLQVHLFHLTSGGVRTASGPGVDPSRTAINIKHDSHVARRLLDNAERLQSYFDYCVETGLGDPGWELALQSFTDVFGGESFWERNADGNAVRVINAANAFFAEADHVFVIGLASEEFPSERSPPSFLHDELYQETWQVAQEADHSESPRPYLYFPSPEDHFQQDLDEYKAAVETSSDQVWLLRQFRDAEGDAVPWSSFVDAFTSRDTFDDIHHIQLSDWLPSGNRYGSWQTATLNATTRDRLRMSLYHLPDGLNADTYTPRLSPHPLDSERGLVELLARVDGRAFENELEPRRSRYLGDDIGQIEVNPESSVFNRYLNLEEIVGGPVRLHELDLYAKCSLKYYFYQYLFAAGGSTIERDEIPGDMDPYSTEEYGQVPTILRAHYAKREHREGMRHLIESPDRLADRQGALRGYSSVRDLRDDLREWIAADDITSSVIQPVLSEYLAVSQEDDAGIERSWEWVDEGTVAFDDTDVVIPGHRVDTFPERDSYLPVWYTGQPSTAKIATKRCWHGSGVSSPDDREICRNCGASEYCDYDAKFILDHRLKTARFATSDFEGVMFQEPYRTAPSSRQGVVVGLDNTIPEEIPHEANLEQVSEGDWDDWDNYWETAISTNTNHMTGTDSAIEYSVSDRFVAEGGCEGCAFRDLCQVPFQQERGDN